MDTTKDEIWQLLYEDEHGEVIGLDEVQLLDPPPVERIPALQALLRSDDLYLAYQAAMVLAAWGDEQGLDKIEELIDMRVHESIEIAPHRIYDYDNVYDELARSVYYFSRSTTQHTTQCKRIFVKLLKLYGECDFSHKLKYALFDSGFTDLAPDVQAAIERSLMLGKQYLASQLLPVLAKWQPQAAWNLLPRVLSLLAQIPNPAANVAEALKYINTSDSRSPLAELTRHQDHAVAEEARRSLDELTSER